LSGSYITLSNTSWEDLKRIVELKLSPLYVSVHAWDQEVRQRLVRSQNDEFQEKFMFLIEHGIELHCQIVVCPEINDGTILEETVRRLLELAPQILSVALVPVGLTE
jgi:NifB/MoaA-like Fe-S oxidoreductase